MNNFEVSLFNDHENDYSHDIGDDYNRDGDDDPTCREGYINLVYMRHISAGDVVDADPPPESIVISPEEFVRYVVRHIDDAL